MRTRPNFRDMADACERIFSDNRLKRLHLRFFDPTLSAARGHEDKGLIECLMVKCAKLLVYCEGEKESYGKDAEAAMALSLGKPVIFYCDKGKKTNFYRDVHPLARLIDFRSGVAVGAIVSDDVDQVSELIHRFFTNAMEYRIEHHATRSGFLKLVEKLTGSVVRFQTDDRIDSSSRRSGIITITAHRSSSYPLQQGKRQSGYRSEDHGAAGPALDLRVAHLCAQQRAKVGLFAASTGFRFLRFEPACRLPPR